MRLLQRFILPLVLALSVPGARADTNNNACDITQDSTSTGFNAVFYSYASGDQSTYKSDTYMSYGYKDNATIASATNVINPNFSYDTSSTFWPGNWTVYNQTIPATHSTLELTGYFKAPETGTYTFKYTHDTGGRAVAFFGNSAAFYCCNTDNQSNSTDYLAESTKLDLKAGSYYPIRVVYTNFRNGGELNLEMDTPSGSKLTNTLGDYIYQFSNTGDTSCPSPSTVGITSTWTGSPSDTTFTSNGTPYSEHLVPPAISTVGTTSTWTGSVPSDTTFTSNGTPYSEHLVPPAVSTVDTTSTWTGSVPSDTTFTSGGTTYSEHLVPGTPFTVQTTSTYTGTTPSDTTFTSNGTPYSEFLVPGTAVIQETTVTWSETFISTVTSNCPNGVISVIVQIPCDTTTAQATVTTTTVPCDCSEKETSTSTDGKGNTVIVVGTPNKGVSNSADVTLTTTILCDGTLITTSTTTNGNGNIVIAVGTPKNTLTTLLSTTNSSSSIPAISIAEGSGNALSKGFFGIFVPLISLLLI